MINVYYDFSVVQRQLEEFKEDLLRKIVKKGVDAGGGVLVKAYRSALQAHHQRTNKVSGTYRSASGAVEHFMAAYDAVEKRSLLFKDRTGAYSVVGIMAAANNWRPLSPQAQFLESGTIEREKASGASTGSIQPALRILEQVAEQFTSTAQQKCIEVIEKECSVYSQ